MQNKITNINKRKLNKTWAKHPRKFGKRLGNKVMRRLPLDY